MRFRLMLAAALAAASAASAPVSAQITLNVVTAGDQNMVEYVTNYLGPKFEAMNPGVKVRAVGTGPGDAGSQKIYEKLSAQQKAGVRCLGRRRRGGPPARRRNDGQGKPAPRLSQRRRRRQARLARHREERARRQRRRLRAADVPQPDRVRLQPRPRESAAEVVRRAHRVGEKEPEAVRLQRRQGRHVRRRLRDGLGLGQFRPRRQAGEGSVRGRRQGDDRKVPRGPQGLQPERRDDTGQRRHARHAEPGRDRDGSRCGSTCSTRGRRTAR